MDFYKLLLFSSPFIIKIMGVYCRQFLNADQYKKEK